MIQNYVFMTDSNSDLPYQIADERQIPVIKMPYMVDGKEYYDDNGRTYDAHAFFESMRNGAVPSTSLLPTPDYIDYFEPILAQGKDLLFVAFSSEMSSTIQNVYAARSFLLEKYPERAFTVVDTMNISCPMTLLILGAHDLYLKGCSMQEVAQWIEQNKMRSHAILTVDDLKYLKRGGRISSTSAFFGTMLDIKPILVMSKNGKISPADKVKGRKKAIRTLVEKTYEYIENPAEQVVRIVHADALADAEKLKEMLIAKIPDVKDVAIDNVGPVIGAHCGPGTLSISFFGKEKDL